jgi:hypothetical protein
MNNKLISWNEGYEKGYADAMQAKTLTGAVGSLSDEEIALVWHKFSALPSPKDIKDFARAILRKAQEK